MPRIFQKVQTKIQAGIDVKCRHNREETFKNRNNTQRCRNKVRRKMIPTASLCGGKALPIFENLCRLSDWALNGLKPLIGTAGACEKSIDFRAY